MANLNLPDNIESLSGPEKLVICIDSAFVNIDFKKILRQFVEMKCLVNRHEIALFVFNGSDVFIQTNEFHTEVRNALNPLWDMNRLRYQDQHSQHKSKFDLNKIFTKVYQLASPFKNENVCLRVIILYARVDIVPLVENDAPLEALRRDFPYFTLDVLYMPQFSLACPKSRKLAEHQRAQEVVQSFLGIIDSKSYIFAIDSSKDLAPGVLKFLAHPALREKQNPNWLNSIPSTDIDVS